MAEKIYRNKTVQEEVEVPEGHEVCSDCKGRGEVSKYDLGWNSLAHSPELAAMRACERCDRQGHHPKGEPLGFNVAL